jgi:hypothetical protein
MNRYVDCKNLKRRIYISDVAIPEIKHDLGWICDCGNWTNLDFENHKVVD